MPLLLMVICQKKYRRKNLLSTYQALRSASKNFSINEEHYGQTSNV